MPAVLWGWYDRRTGRRISASSCLSRVSAERQLERWRVQDAAGARRDLHELLDHIEVRSFTFPYDDGDAGGR